MRRYAVETIMDGTVKYYFIRDCETLEIVTLPSRYLKHKIKSKRSPNTVKRSAFSICYYLEYLGAQGKLTVSHPIVCPAPLVHEENKADNQLSRAEIDSFFMALNREYENSRENRVTLATKTFRIPNPFYFS